MTESSVTWECNNTIEYTAYLGTNWMFYTSDNYK